MPTIDLRGKKGPKPTTKTDVRLAMEHAEREYTRREAVQRQQAEDRSDRAKLFTDYGIAQKERRLMEAAAKEQAAEKQRAIKAAAKVEEAEQRKIAKAQESEQRKIAKAQEAEQRKIARAQEAEQRKIAREQESTQRKIARAQVAEQNKIARAQDAAQKRAEREHLAPLFQGYGRAQFDNRLYEAGFGAPGQYEEAMAANRARTPPGGGGRGGGGRGPGSAAFGGGFLGGGIVGLLEKHPLTAGAMALGAGAVETMLAPGQITGAMLSMVDELYTLRKQTSAMGMAGGFSGPGLQQMLAMNLPEFSAMGITPQRFMESMGRFGIAPTSAGQAIDYAQVLRQQMLLPGFAGMDEGTAEQVARQGAGYGLATGPGGVDAYLNRISATMTESIAQGMDRAKVLDAIQGSIDSIAKSGALGVSSTAILDMVARFSGSGLLTGMTGAAAEKLLSTEADKNANPMADMQRQFIMSSQLLKYGNLQTENDVLGAIGGNNKAAALLLKSKNPTLYNKQMQDVLGAGTPFLRSSAVQELFMGADPSRAAELVANAAKQIFPNNGYLQLQMIRRETGLSGPEAEQYILGGGKKAPAGLTSMQQSSLLNGINMPKDVFGLETKHAQYQLQGEDYVNRTLVPAAEKFSDGVSKFNAAVDKIIHGINDAAAKRQFDPGVFDVGQPNGNWWKSSFMHGTQAYTGGYVGGYLTAPPAP